MFQYPHNILSHSYRNFIMGPHGSASVPVAARPPRVGVFPHQPPLDLSSPIETVDILTTSSSSSMSSSAPSEEEGEGSQPPNVGRRPRQSIIQGSARSSLKMIPERAADEQSQSPQAGPSQANVKTEQRQESVIRSVVSNNPPINIDLSSDSDDECQFVLARKPPHLRTPEYVSLNSDDEDSDVIFVERTEGQPATGGTAKEMPTPSTVAVLPAASRDTSSHFESVETPADEADMLDFLRRAACAAALEDEDNPHEQQSMVSSSSSSSSVATCNHQTVAAKDEFMTPFKREKREDPMLASTSTRYDLLNIPSAAGASTTTMTMSSTAGWPLSLKRTGNSNTMDKTDRPKPEKRRRSTINPSRTFYSASTSSSSSSRSGGSSSSTPSSSSSSDSSDSDGPVAKYSHREEYGGGIATRNSFADEDSSSSSSSHDEYTTNVPSRKWKVMRRKKPSIKLTLAKKAVRRQRRPPLAKRSPSKRLREFVNDEDEEEEDEQEQVEEEEETDDNLDPASTLNTN